MITLSYEDWLYKKAQKHAHDEILASQMMIFGIVMLIGGLMIILLRIGEPNSIFLFMPYDFIQNPMGFAATLGLILTTLGFMFVFAGFVFVFHYDRRRSFFINQIDQQTQREHFSIEEVNRLIREMEKNKKAHGEELKTEEITIKKQRTSKEKTKPNKT